MTWLPPTHLALSLVILLWDIVLAGRIAQLRQSPRPLAALSGLAALLVLPGLILHLATSTVVTGRAVIAVDWIWPLVLVLFAAQAVYALARRLVNPWWGVPIAAYDLVIATAGVTRFAIAHGFLVLDPLLALVVAQSNALAFINSGAALTSPFYLNVPLISPTFAALRGFTAAIRGGVALLASGWLVLIAIELPSDSGPRSYEAHANDRLTERPQGDFQIGLKLFPDIGSAPPPPAVRNDISLADTLDVDAVSVVVVPDVSNAVLDSVSHSLDQLERDSITVIVGLGYRGELVPELGHVALNEEQRLSAVRRIVSHLSPDILLPAEGPYGVGARLLGRLPVSRWKDYLTRAAAIAKRADPRVRIGVSISAFDSRDSALYAWAASSGSPLDVVGFSLFPTRAGALGLEASMRAADRWMQLLPPVKPHWVFGTGGYPLAHGEMSQEQAIWASLAWATAHPMIKGVIVVEAGDYGQSRGLRAPDGRLRPAAFAVMRALNGLRESAPK